ncbi:MAG TPA: papain-like cysteine protease family protein [Bacteroidales bacterium]|nr:papain-like cysteine protease family protein [Bacteroidales bacterium]
MENRFIEMDQLITAAGKNKNISHASSLTDTIARSFDAVFYRVPGIVSPIRQPSSMVCWATVTTMMISWKRQQSLSIETAVGGIGAYYLSKYKNNQGLTSEEKIPFLNAAGFLFEYPQSLSIGGWERLLKNNGPIWITTAEGSDANFGIHARILTAINGDGTADGTTITVVDPASGTAYNEKFSDFLVKFEREVRVSSAWDGRIQIVYWPAGTSVAKTFTAEKSWNISAQGVDLIKKYEGFFSKMYNDPVGHCTIGYGTLIHQGNCNGDETEKVFTNGITETKALELLRDEVNKHMQTIRKNVNVDLNQNQIDSLASFTYNVGDANFLQSTLLKRLNAGKYSDVPLEIRKWTKGRINGKLVDLQGLVNRRNEEAALFETPLATSQSYTYYAFGQTVLSDADLNNYLSDALPVRTLTLTRARDILQTLAANSSSGITLDAPPFNASLKVSSTRKWMKKIKDQPDQEVTETHDVPRTYTVKPSVINGVEIKYMNTATGGILLPNLNNLDPRMVVFLYKFTKWLKNTYGVDTLYHMGIGHGSGAQFDCHNTGRALDLGGLKGTYNGTAFEVFVQRDWGSKPAKINGGKIYYRLSSSDGFGYTLFKEVHRYIVTQMSDTSNYYEAAKTGSDLDARVIQDGVAIPSSFIIHPDHPDASLRSAHSNHFHCQVGTTSYEANPPV